MTPRTEAVRARYQWAGGTTKLDEMARSLKSLASLLPWRRGNAYADKLYGAIVARSRLPVFYQEFSVPDTLEGRFVVLSLHLFAALHRLKAEGPEALDLAQALADRFTADMETVLREIGIGDLTIPKKVRGVAASGAALLQDYEEALAKGDAAMAAAIARALALEPEPANALSRRLAHYLRSVVRHLEAEPLTKLRAGELTIPEVSEVSGKTLGR
jgi:cytochrome b pre-mRNA-processing protein 3